MVCMFFVSSSLPLVRFGQLLRRYADQCIVNIMQVYIERNDLQVEVIRCRNKMLTLFTYTLTKRRNQCNIAHRKKIRRFRAQNHFCSILTVLMGRCGICQLRLEIRVAFQYVIRLATLFGRYLRWTSALSRRVDTTAL